MFTERRIALSGLACAPRLDIRRDARIAFAGKIPTQLPHRIVAASTRAHLDQIAQSTGIACVICPAPLGPDVPDTLGLVISVTPMATLAKVQTCLAETEGLQWASYRSSIHPSAIISETAQIAPRDVVIGAGCMIGPNVVIEERSRIADGCTIAAGCVIGMAPFDEAKGMDDRRLMTPSGGVMIGDHVTLQPGVMISRASFGGFTELGKNCLIDAHVVIAHDCTIGAGVTICAHASLSGRVHIDEGAYIGPRAAISNGVALGKESIVSIGSIVTRDVPPETRVTGNFALPHDRFLAQLRKFR